MGGIRGLSLEYVMYFLFLPNESFECHSRNVSVFRYAIQAVFSGFYFLHCPDQSALIAG